MVEAVRFTALLSAVREVVPEVDDWRADWNCENKGPLTLAELSCLVPFHVFDDASEVEAFAGAGMICDAPRTRGYSQSGESDCTSLTISMALDSVLVEGHEYWLQAESDIVRAQTHQLHEKPQLKRPGVASFLRSENGLHHGAELAYIVRWWFR